VPNGSIAVPASNYFGRPGLELKYFRHPITQRAQLAYYTGVALADSMSYRTDPNLNVPYTNLVYGAMPMGQAVAMYGGGQRGGYPGEVVRSQFDVFAEIISNLVNELGREGIIVKKSEVQAVLTKLKKLGEIEVKVHKYIRVLQKLVSLQKWVNKMGQAPQNRVEVGMDRLMTKHELLEWLARNRGEYETCIYKNMNYMDSEMTSVLRTYQGLLRSASVN
jgi:hypothetical protein